ncbi:MAG: terminase family protein [Deltaproteobacteria bacterium]|nr:terminase family protein [Deltaproteobacteria bacterium]
MASSEGAMNHAPTKAAIPLTEYQRNWVQDKSRFKIGVVTRQGGKSFATALEAVLDCVEHKTMWVFLSAGERQSKELMGKAALHSRAIGHAVQELETEFWADKDTKYKMLEIVYPNGSRIVGLPANPDTARGWSANILLDEFALHRDSREIWKALFPTVTRGYKIRVISTFKGKTNKFYELFFGAPTLQSYNGKDYEFKGEKGGWSKHFVSIAQAVEMGLELKDDQGKPCDPEDLRLALNDDDAWGEEYECVPSDEVSAFLTHELISSVEDVTANGSPEWAALLIKAAEENYREFKQTKIAPPLPTHVLANVVFLGELFGGMDIGRKRDLSVIWLDQKIDNVLRPAAVIELKRQPFFVQEQVLHTILARKELRRACIDETGIGAQLTETAQNLYGSHKVEGIAFTAESKETLAVGLKQNFEDRGSVIPADHTVRNSLHSVKKYATTTKHFRFDAERTEATGHADHFWAKALVVQAAQSNIAPAAASSETQDTDYRAERPGRIERMRDNFRNLIRRAA